MADKRWLVRHSAIEALGNCADSRAIELLLGVAARSVDPFELAYLSGAFGRLWATAAVEFLVRNVAQPAEDVACSALHALIKIIPTSVLPHLLRALQDRRWVVKGMAMIGFEQHGDASAIQPVLARVKKTLSKDRKIHDGPPSELTRGLGFLWRFRDSSPAVAEFFAVHLPAKVARLRPAELAALDQLPGRSPLPKPP